MSMKEYPSYIFRLDNLHLVNEAIKLMGKENESKYNLFEVGEIGLQKAIDNYKVESGVDFKTYATPMIIGEIRRFLKG